MKIHTNFYINSRMTRKVLPQEWEMIVAKYPNKFIPRMIQQVETEWYWQASSKKRINITNWLLRWNVDGEEILATLGAFTQT
uniref:Uncharacterized protein n=1 Tax=viral metagenome TaxID=1070528 RepID=A0A6C0JWP3_9ZZZZ